MELMKLDVLGKLIAGEDLKLLEKYDETFNKKEKKVNEAILLKSGFEII